MIPFTFILILKHIGFYFFKLQLVLLKLSIYFVLFSRDCSFVIFLDYNYSFKLDFFVSMLVLALFFKIQYNFYAIPAQLCDLWFMCFPFICFFHKYLENASFISFAFLSSLPFFLIKIYTFIFVISSTQNYLFTFNTLSSESNFIHHQVFLTLIS